MLEIIDGIYSVTKKQVTGSTSSSRTQTITEYFTCTKVDDNTMRLQILDIYGDMKTSNFEDVPMTEFLKYYNYEPDKFEKHKGLTTKEVSKTIAIAKRPAGKLSFMPVIPKGIYSEAKKQVIGTMSTSRTQTVTDFYHCIQVDENTVSVQIVDIYGDPMLVSPEEVSVVGFLKRFNYEPEKFKKHKAPSNPVVDKTIAIAERHVSRKEYHSGEYEYGKALKLDEENVRANFGLGKLYVEIGEVEKAINVFSSLSRQDNVLEPENKHFFNELGIELRSLMLYEQAIDFYYKALGVAPDDENLMFNIARAFMENGNKDEAEGYLDRALDINPGMEAARRLMESLGERCKPAKKTA